MLGGAFRWAVRAGGSKFEEGYSIAVSEHGLVVAGFISGRGSNINFNDEEDLVVPGGTEQKFIVMKLDCWNGDLIWYSVGERVGEGFTGSSKANDVDM